MLLFIVGNAYSLTNDQYNTIYSDSSDYSCSAYPPWFIFDKSAEKCQCGDRLGGRVNCDNAIKKVYIYHCYCMTYDDILGTIVGACMTNCFVKNQSHGSLCDQYANDPVFMQL